jgi:spoIIIJ-associated protein
MKKVEADSLEEAYQKAATLLQCSITDLQYEVIQYPSKGILGLMKKKAIIVASCKQISNPQDKSINIAPIEDKIQEPTIEQEVANEIIESIQEDNHTTKEVQQNIDFDAIEVQNDTVIDNFFCEEKASDTNQTQNNQEQEAINKELSILIENELKQLMDVSCFDIDVVEVDVVDKTAYIFIDGADAALLIGKEGYRYNALSYMLFNWLNSKYDLFIKLEIAEFIQSQKEMIKHYMQPVIQEVNENGRAKTRFLDGILVQLALEELRGEFPNKYVAIKTAKNGKKFVVVNDFNSKPNA